MTVTAWALTASSVTVKVNETLPAFCSVTFGAGGLTVIGGTVGVIAFLSFFAGTEVGIQGYASLSQIGVAKLSAFISAYQTVAPLKLGELWAIPIMLRLALIENLRRVSARIAIDQRQREMANQWADKMLAMMETVVQKGGTGPQGRGLAYRFARGGLAVRIGSRNAERGKQTAEELAEAERRQLAPIDFAPDCPAVRAVESLVERLSEETVSR